MRPIFLAALTLSTLGAQPYPTAESLLKRNAEALSKLHSIRFHDELTNATTFTGLQPSMTDRSEISIAMVNPGKARVELKSPDGTTLLISDGDSIWAYSSDWQEYTRKSAAAGPEGLLAWMGIDDMMPHFGDAPLTAKTIGEDSVTIEGKKYDCWLVEIHVAEMEMPGRGKSHTSDLVMTHWFDKQLGLDLQRTLSMKVIASDAPLFEMKDKMVRLSMQIDGPVPDSEFTFTPPAGAKLVDPLGTFGGKRDALPDLVGETAPLLDPAMKGKRVLVNFSAPWCAPCRTSAPAVEKPGLPVWAPDKPEILKAYHVVAFPTFVVIGADGKVAAYEIGFAGEARLRALLEKGAKLP